MNDGEHGADRVGRRAEHVGEELRERDLVEQPVAPDTKNRAATSEKRGRTDARTLPQGRSARRDLVEPDAVLSPARDHAALARHAEAAAGRLRLVRRPRPGAGLLDLRCEDGAGARLEDALAGPRIADGGREAERVALLQEGALGRRGGDGGHDLDRGEALLRNPLMLAGRAGMGAAVLGLRAADRRAAAARSHPPINKPAPAALLRTMSDSRAETPARARASRRRGRAPGL